MASEGANVAVMGRRREPLQALADDTGCFVVQADAADSVAVRAALQEIHGKFGKVDILIANAGGHGVGPTISMTDETWSLATRLNLDTAFVCARESLPDLIAQKGAVVVVASIAGLFAGPDAASYVTMKHACIGFGKSLARDYGRKGVRTNIVCPGWAATAMGSVSPSARTNTPRSKQVSAYPRAQPGAARRCLDLDRAEQSAICFRGSMIGHPPGDAPLCVRYACTSRSKRLQACANLAWFEAHMLMGIPFEFQGNSLKYQDYIFSVAPMMDWSESLSFSIG